MAVIFCQPTLVGRSWPSRHRSYFLRNAIVVAGSQQTHLNYSMACHHRIPKCHVQKWDEHPYKSFQCFGWIGEKRCGSVPLALLFFHFFRGYVWRWSPMNHLMKGYPSVAGNNTWDGPRHDMNFCREFGFSSAIIGASHKIFSWPWNATSL